MSPFAEKVVNAKGVDARNMIPGCESLPELQEILGTETRKIVTQAVKSRMRALRKKEAREAEDGATIPLPLGSSKEPDPIKRSRVETKETKTCPKCGVTGLVSQAFGVRKMKRTRKDGTEIVTVRAQSHCKSCRGQRKPKAE